jgi:uncharacterized membrane protein (UPF0127 family)
LYSGYDKNAMVKARFFLALSLITLFIHPHLVLNHAYGQSLRFKSGYSSVAVQLIPVEFAQTAVEREKGLSGRNLDKNNRINQIESLKANSLKTISSRSEQIKYAFEVPRGFFTKMGIKVGDEFLIFK